MANGRLNKAKSSFSWEAVVNTGLLHRVLVTLGLLAFYRLGVHVPLPGIDGEVFRANSQLLSTGILGLVDMFAGGALSALSVFALGIGPFITASIMMQLLAEIFPSLKALQREHGEQGRREYQQWTRRLTLLIALLQGFALVKYIQSASVGLMANPEQAPLITSSLPTWLFMLKMLLLLAAGSLFVMWLGELITEFGIGNGGSLLIFAGIAARMPQLVKQTHEAYLTGSIPSWGLISLLIFFALVILGIIYLQEGARKLLIVGARNNFGGGVIPSANPSSTSGHYLPLKVNPAGVLPIIFASMTMFLPLQLLAFLGKQSVSISTGIHDLFVESSFLQPFAAWVASTKAALVTFTFLGHTLDNLFINRYSWEHSLLYLGVILMFSYFYASILLPAREIAENLQKGGNSIQGVKLGKPTGDYLEYLLNRLIFIGGIALALVTILPIHVERFCQVTTLGALGGTSLIIMVGVAIDLYNQVQSYLQAHQYKARSLLL